MKLFYTTVLLLTIVFCKAQNFHTGVVVDHEVLEPLEFVNIFNAETNTLSNADGRFAFSSLKDSVVFYRVGYDKLETTFEQLQDTVYLEKSLFELDEVVVTNSKTLWQKVKDSIPKNYFLEPQKEKFLLRCILKYNDTIARIQDIQGKLERKTLLYTKKEDIGKKDYKVEIENMRKVGLVFDSQDAYFIFPSFYNIWSQFAGLNTTGDGYGANEVSYFDSGKKIKLQFGANPEKQVGYYILNAKNLAIEEFYLKSEPRGPFSKSKSFRYRTTLYETHIFFEQHNINKKYFIRSAKGRAKVENTNEAKSFRGEYDIAFLLTTSNNFEKFNVVSNVKEQRDLFKINYPYNESFWNTQNQLLLTEEMQDFVKKIGKENKEFKVRSNLDYP